MPRPSTYGLCCALALAASAPAWAADPPSPPPSPESQAAEHDKLVQSFREEVKGDRRPEEEESFGAKSVLWTFAAMGFVIAVIYITLNFGLRRLMGARAVGSAQLVSVVERVVLDQRKSILVLRAAGEYMLVGASEGGIHLICKLDAQQVERLEREARVQSPGISPFLQKLLSRKGGPPPPQA
ncbi:MAG TPA: flagellar biosynthetic protein FliO [Myxococcaceae bacterium]|nr:flagellar biosynthetic protein FliO [Myxococcaceae bacterium]